MRYFSRTFPLSARIFASFMYIFCVEGVEDGIKSWRRTFSKLGSAFLVLFFGALGGLASEGIVDIVAIVSGCLLAWQMDGWELNSARLTHCLPIGPRPIGRQARVMQPHSLLIGPPAIRRCRARVRAPRLRYPMTTHHTFISHIDFIE